MAAKSYNIQEALKFVLEPNSDSELSDLSDGKDEDNIQQVTVQPRIRDSESEDEVNFDNQEKIKSADETDQKKALRVLLKEKMMITKTTCQDSKKSYQDGEEINHQQPTIPFLGKNLAFSR